MSPRRQDRRLELSDLRIVVRGAGEMATGTACRLYRSGFFRLLLTEVAEPLAVRRGVSFSEAVYQGHWTVEGIQAMRIHYSDQAQEAWNQRVVPVIVDPENTITGNVKPDVVVDAILAKRNLGTTIRDAPWVIALGPGFVAGTDVHCVVETNRGHHLGRLVLDGPAEPDTGVPGDIAGYTALRVIRSPATGTFHAEVPLGASVREGQTLGHVDGIPVRAPLSGVLRGMIRPGIRVTERLKIGDVDPRGDTSYCHTISEKARAIGGTVLEAILMKYNNDAYKLS
jgi:xanthine dehydrogenase accessory factor